MPCRWWTFTLSGDSPVDIFGGQYVIQTAHHRVRPACTPFPFYRSPRSQPIGPQALEADEPIFPLEPFHVSFLSLKCPLTHPLVLSEAVISSPILHLSHSSFPSRLFSCPIQFFSFGDCYSISVSLNDQQDQKGSEWLATPHHCGWQSGWHKKALD